ncbi:hypothetical protein [Clostridium botulinum]|nr:hypothetical protein [Clostridium botulinum]
MLPEDKINLIRDFDTNVNHRDCMVSEATYIKGFKDGTKLILELLK